MLNSTYAPQSLKPIAAPSSTAHLLNELFAASPLGIVLAALKAPTKRR